VLLDFPQHRELLTTALADHLFLRSGSQRLYGLGF